jgi:hypothetical protein
MNPIGNPMDVLQDLDKQRALWIKSVLLPKRLDLYEISDEECQKWFDSKGYKLEHTVTYEESCHTYNMQVELWQESGDLAGMIARTTLTSYVGGTYVETPESKSLRVIQRRKSDNWEVVRMSELVDGDHFRVDSPDEDHINGKEFIARSNPYMNEDQVWTIESEMVKRCSE